MSRLILEPVAALMVLTFAVWAYLYVLRLRYVRAQRISPAAVATPERINELLPEAVNRPSNNLKNLCELPILFYAICLALFAADAVDALYLGLAWAYVALRALHSAIHCTVNHVPARFCTYMLSSFVLWVMVGRFALLAFEQT